jgi:CO/xanthine dehydrogenase FAD-binding subunit
MAIFYRKLPRFAYIRPRTVEEALSLLDEHREAAKLLAGGTDLLPQLKGRQVDLPRYVIDLKRIAGLDGITYDDRAGLTIGALTTMSAIAESAVLRDRCPLLIRTALSMASPQVRNRGTFAGNICNAIPSADSAPSLLALEAKVRLKGPRGERLVALDQFFTGPRKTIIGLDEILTSIEVPEPSPSSRSVYLKLSPRHSMDLAVVGVAVVGTPREGTCAEVRIAVGAVAPTPRRAPMAEAMLRGQKITPEIIDEAARNAVTQCDPIDDHRASREYRCDMVHVMIRRALSQVLLGQTTKD